MADNNKNEIAGFSDFPDSAKPPEKSGSNYLEMESKQNYAKQSIMGGMENTVDPSTTMSANSTDNHEAMPTEASQPSEPPMNMSGTVNEVTAGGSRSKLAMAAVGLGVLLLLLGVGAYYYINYMGGGLGGLFGKNQPVPTVTPEPTPEAQVNFQEDSVIKNFQNIEDSQPTNLNELNTQMKSADYNTIDSDMKMEGLPEATPTPTPDNGGAPTEPEPMLQQNQ